MTPRFLLISLCKKTSKYFISTNSIHRVILIFDSVNYFSKLLRIKNFKSLVFESFLPAWRRIDRSKTRKSEVFYRTLITICWSFTVFAIQAQENQILKLEEDWFSNSNFFNPDVVQKHSIKAIHLWVSEKKDGQIFEKEKSFLHYLFNHKGQLIKSYKEIRLKGKVDTSIFSFHYDENGNCIQKDEERSPFHFSYFYQYKNQKIQTEIKIDRQTLDTNYIYYFQHRRTAEKHEIDVSHAPNSKAFKTLITLYDSMGRKIVERKRFRQNRNYTETNYFYRENSQNFTKISEKQFYNSVQKQDKKFEYNDGVPDFMQVEKDGELDYKIGFTYNRKGLVKAIIKRELDRKMVSIYRFEYLYE